MPEISIPRLQKHWKLNAIDFSKHYKKWIALYSEILHSISKACDTLQGKKLLAENCSYLLLSKAINHSLGSFSLMEKGLCIDAALCARNAIETALLLKLCILDPSEKLFSEWIKGKHFKPAWVRDKLSKIKEVQVRDVIINIGDDEHETTGFVYKWWSEITHSNVDSLHYTISQTEVSNSYLVYTGGNLKGAENFINAIFAVTCRELLVTTVFVFAVLNRSYLEENIEQFNKLQERVNILSKGQL